MTFGEVVGLVAQHGGTLALALIALWMLNKTWEQRVNEAKVVRDIADNRWIEVVDRNTQSWNSNTVAIMEVSKAITALLQSHADVSARIQNVEHLMRDHEKEVAARPCIAAKPVRRVKEP